MAKTVQKPFVGQRVYQIGSPQKAGIIVSFISVGKYFDDVKVLWLNGTTEAVSTSWVRDFDSLIADHLKKLDTHLDRKKKLDKLAESL